MHCRIAALFLGLSNTCGNRNAQYLTSGTLSQCQPICLSYCLTRPHSVCPAPKDFRHSQPNQVGMNHHQEVRWMYKRSVCIFSWLELLFSYLANCCDWLTDLWSNVQLSQKKRMKYLFRACWQCPWLSEGRRQQPSCRRQPSLFPQAKWRSGGGWLKECQCGCWKINDINVRFTYTVYYIA